MAFQILDVNQNVLETVDDDSQIQTLLEDESGTFHYLLWDVDIFERLVDAEDNTRLIKRKNNMVHQSKIYIKVQIFLNYQIKVEIKLLLN